MQSQRLQKHPFFIPLLSVALIGALSSAVAAPSLLELSDSIDRYDAKIYRAENDSLRALWIAEQQALMAQADSLKVALVAERDSLNALSAKTPVPVQSVAPSLKEELKQRWLIVLLGVLLLCSITGFVLRKKFKPRRSALRQEKELTIDSTSAVAHLRTHELKIEPPQARRKVARSARTAVPAPSATIDDAAMEKLEQSPDEVEMREGEAELESLAYHSPQSKPKAARERRTAPQKPLQLQPNAEESGDSPPIFLSPSTLTRLEEEDRTRADILKLTRRGYTGSEISRRMRIPQEQVEQVVRQAQLKGE